MANRSTMGPESRRNAFEISASLHRHREGPSPRYPQGHGFDEAPTMQRAGMRAMPPAREMCTSPDSSGPRSASRTLRGNSASSSRQSIPPQAKLSSPGTRPAPPWNPPTRPSGEVAGCGERKGTCAGPTESSPRMARNRSCAVRSFVDGGGSNPWMHRRKVDFPEPGGPRIKTWW